MKILLIVDDYLPHSIKAAAKMMHELALDFKKKGHEVSVLTPQPLQLEPLVINKIDGIRILYFRSGEIKNIGKIKRAVNESLLSWQAWKSTKKYFCASSYDGIVYFSPTIFWGCLIKKLRTLWKCPTYLILRDIFPQWVVDNGMISKHSSVICLINLTPKTNQF